MSKISKSAYLIGEHWTGNFTEFLKTAPIGTIYIMAMKMDIEPFEYSRGLNRNAFNAGCRLNITSYTAVSSKDMNDIVRMVKLTIKERI